LKVFVTGTEGYIGHRLAPMLLADGHDVTGLDSGFYCDGNLFSRPSSEREFPRLVRKDLRNITIDDINGFDAVVHLAELSNDPFGENNPDLTFRINHEGSVKLARLAREADVRRFIYASSCSVYGVGSEEAVTEESAVNPQRARRASDGVERRLRRLPQERNRVWSVAAHAVRRRAERPVRTCVDHAAHRVDERRHAVAPNRAHREHLRRDPLRARGGPCGRQRRSLQCRNRQRKLPRTRNSRDRRGGFPGCDLVVGPKSPDNRSYRVSFAKISRGLPGFRCNWTARMCAAELHALFSRIEMSKDTYEFRAFTRLKQLRYLARTGQIDAEFYWTV